MTPRRTIWTELKSGCRLGLVIAMGAWAVLLPAPPSGRALQRPTGQIALPAEAPQWRQAEFGAHLPSLAARQLVTWVAASGDNGGSAFLVVDKLRAEVLIFDAQARLTNFSPVLLGAATGDESVPGIGRRPMTAIQGRERTTPAGRFVGERGRNAAGEDVVWVDYDAAISMHRVRLTNPAEHRAERLASASSADRRISYGCINVPTAFYEQYIRPAFAQRRAVIYVLPDVRSVQDVFGLQTSQVATLPVR